MDKKKMVESFPFSSHISSIKKEYFDIFYAEFAERILMALPTASSALFLRDEEEAKALLTESELSLWHRLVKQEIFSAVDNASLFFSLPGKESPVVYVQGADPLFLRRMDEGWLQNVCHQLMRDFHLICLANIDSATGLPNLHHLQFLLDNWQKDTGGFLALVELPVRYGSLRRKCRYIQWCSQVLTEFVHNPACVHYVAQDTFALIFPCSDRKGEQVFADFENSLIAFLKKEGCFRVHIGSALWLPGMLERFDEADRSLLLDQAWNALQCAEKRGPFSFCNYQHLACPEQNRLAPASNSLQLRLRKLWQTLSRFSLLLVRADSSGKLPSVIRENLVREAFCLQEGDEYYLLFAGDDGRQAQKQIERLVALSKNNAEGTVSGGIACYPYADFKKSEMVINCRKALIHASFFGEASFAVFDQTSLNISGDIYFGQGDFTRAIFEYRRGIACSQKEVNLYNSLGVTLALMNRLKPALESFSAALSLEPRNFMALYNSGLALKDMGLPEKAFSMLQEAYNCGQIAQEGSGVLHDIELYLGILAVETQQMAPAVDYLLRWCKNCGQKKESGKVYRYLGLAYYGIGEAEKAITSLQNALRYHQFDAQALSLLGYLYLQTGEGAEVACTLCRKSVEFEPDNLVFLLRFAEALVACGDYEQGRQYLQRCQRSGKFRCQAWLLLGELYLLQGKKSAAYKYFKKLSGKQGLASDMRKRLQNGMKNCEKTSKL